MLCLRLNVVGVGVMVLTTLIQIDGPMGWVLLLAPLAILVVVVVGVIARRDRTRPNLDPGQETRPVGEPAVAMCTTSTSATPSTSAITPASSFTQLTHNTPQVDTSGSSAPVPASVPPAREASVGPSAPNCVPQFEPEPIKGPDTSKDEVLAAIDADEIKLREAERRFDDAAVARLSLQLARDLMTNSAPDGIVTSHLRRAIILASRLKDNDTHAAARLELGDIMARQSDLTSACEHWQIARQIFWDQGEKERQNDVDQRMMANHCPTDWVLNDF